jgi:Tol biopolymer transport system component
VRRSLLVSAVLVVVAGVVVSLAAGGSGGSVAVSLPAGEIVFARSSVPNTRSDLYAVRPDGSRTRLLSRDASGAAVSRDGLRIAFVRGDAIWVMKRDTSAQHRVTKPSRAAGITDSGPAWSPDGRTIYFSRFVLKTGTDSLFRVGSDGTGLRRLTHPTPTDHGHCQSDPSLSPSGGVIAFEEAEDCEHGSDLFIAAITAAGRPARLPFRFPGKTVSIPTDKGTFTYHLGPTLYDPAWAPNARLLAYATQDLTDTGRTGLYVSAADRSRPARVTSGLDGAPAWSPDSAWITFTRSVVTPDAYPGDIWVVRTDGRSPRRVTHGRADDRDSVWLPLP